WSSYVCSSNLPAAACSHRIGGRKYADRPTLVRPYRKPRTSVGCQRNALATDRGIGASRIGGRKYPDHPTPVHPYRKPRTSAGWSTQCVGHRPRHRCKPHRRPEIRRPPFARAPLPTAAPIRRVSTQRVGHRPQHRHTLPRRPRRASTAPPRSPGRRAPATSFSTALAAAAMPKLAVTIITAPKPPAQSSFTPSPTKLLLWHTPPSGLG